MRDIIENAITTEIIKKFLIADFGNILGVYSDGKAVIGQSVGMEIDPDDRPLVCCECPGILNIDGSVYENRALNNDPELDSVTTEEALELLADEEDQDFGLEEDRKFLIEKLI